MMAQRMHSFAAAVAFRVMRAMVPVRPDRCQVRPCDFARPSLRCASAAPEPLRWSPLQNNRQRPAHAAEPRPAETRWRVSGSNRRPTDYENDAEPSRRAADAARRPAETSRTTRWRPSDGWTIQDEVTLEGHQFFCHAACFKDSVPEAQQYGLRLALDEVDCAQFPHTSAGSRTARSPSSCDRTQFGRIERAPSAADSVTT